MPWKKSEPMEERIEFGLRALGDGNFRALCREYGITARTGYKWRERLVRWGTEGLKEESRRPHRSPEALGEREVCEMVRLKQTHSRWGPRKIRELYLRLYGRAASESSFQRMLERAGLSDRPMSCFDAQDCSRSNCCRYATRPSKPNSRSTNVDP